MTDLLPSFTKKGNEITTNLAQASLYQDQKIVGLQFFPDKVIQALVRELPSIRWSEQYNMAYLPNCPANLDKIFNTFRGVAWVNCSHFYAKRPANGSTEPLSIDFFRKRRVKHGKRLCPEPFLQKLELRKSAVLVRSTVR